MGGLSALSSSQALGRSTKETAARCESSARLRLRRRRALNAEKMMTTRGGKKEEEERDKESCKLKNKMTGKNKSVEENLKIMVA